MVFKVGIIKEINVRIREMIKEIIREIIKIKKSYLKDSLSYLAYA